MRDRLFPERQIIFRSRGDVRYIALSTRSQLLMATTVVAFAGWVGYASVNVFYRDSLLDARDRRIAELSLAYDRLSADFDHSQENFVVASRDLEERYRRLYDMTMKQRAPGLPGSAGSPGSNVQTGALPAAPANKAPDTSKLAETADKAPEAKVADAKPAKGKAAAAPAADPAPAVKDAAANAGTKLASIVPVAPLHAGDDHDSADDAAAGEDLEAMQREAKSRPPVPAVKPGDLETRILAVRGRQRELLDDLSQRTEKSVAQMEKALKLTGLDVGGMLARAAEARADVGIGGPLKALGFAGDSKTGGDAAKTGVAVASLGSTDGIDQDMNSLEGKLGRWGELMILAQRLPLAVPMAGDPEVSSTYGRRLDPFTKQWAFHAGIDFIGPLRSPILSTAPGVVVFAGRKGPYGRTVEIDHGLGIKTRYAHMSSITVQTGDTVPYGRQVGTMGSTGRSTGQHLHYEILLDDEQIDPAKFIEAGYHVFKQQEEQSSARR
ncbi:M23 family metallopeptidase [Ferrovibrio xuzhouensis]|uniref:M23 family metallopeptidase n=1 Tax=Ferrovibrio xuzhouensis TaxID=1576914 RepID=A0ABV7VJJ5_9PROT